MHGNGQLVRGIAIDVTTGSTLWTANVGGNLQSTASGDGIVYAGTQNGPARDGVPGDVIDSSILSLTTYIGPLISGNAPGGTRGA